MHTKKNRKKKYVTPILVAALFCGFQDIAAQVNDLGIEHVRVYSEEGRFAGWPANNGIWNWGDEILVGFVEAEHLESNGFHSYNRDSARNKYARSFDGGLTWEIKDAYDLGQSGWAYENILSNQERFY